MSGLLFLTDEDFMVTKGTKKNTLCTAIQGFSLILFYSRQCEHCQTLIPIFKKLPTTMNGCRFGMVNVSKYKKCVQMSKDTVSPITYVPYIVLYIKGRPYVEYKGPHDLETINRFVYEVSEDLKNKQGSEFPKESDDSNKKELPKYTIGKPLYGTDQVCYLTNDEL